MKPRLESSDVKKKKGSNDGSIELAHNIIPLVHAFKLFCGSTINIIIKMIINIDNIFFLSFNFTSFDM
jgi:DNA-binding XRE family transcriptional regulator